MESLENQTGPNLAQEAVLLKSENVPDSAKPIKGYDFASGLDYSKLLDSYATTGFQAQNLHRAIQEVEKMLKWSLDDEPVADDEEAQFRDSAARKRVRTRIWLAFTSNMISCGMREVIKFLVKEKMVQVVITTAGGIEEDFLKCRSPHLTGEFHYDGRKMRGNGINRIGNMIVPNDNYCAFEDWFNPLLNKMHDEQENDGTIWTPSKMIRRMGLEIDNEDSVFYWAAKNDIPVFSPALTDGSIGDMIYFHDYKRTGFILDIAKDIRNINDIALKTRKSGALIIGGGLIKHHCLNANLMRNGADFAVYLTTAIEHDGSDSGASCGEALSWGKIRIDARPVKVFGEASMYFPLIVAKTFATWFHDGRWAERCGDKNAEPIFEKPYTDKEVEKEREKVAAFRGSKWA